MRFLSFILATYILSLTVQPVVKDIYTSFTQQTTEDCCGESCCNDAQADSKQEPCTQDPNNCCPEGICNPFQQCSCCSVVIASQSTLNFITTVIASNFIVAISTDIASGYSADCFHPPEIV